MTRRRRARAARPRAGPKDKTATAAAEPDIKDKDKEKTAPVEPTPRGIDKRTSRRKSTRMAAPKASDDPGVYLTKGKGSSPAAKRVKFLEEQVEEQEKEITLTLVTDMPSKEQLGQDQDGGTTTQTVQLEDTQVVQTVEIVDIDIPVGTIIQNADGTEIGRVREYGHEDTEEQGNVICNMDTGIDDPTNQAPKTEQLELGEPQPMNEKEVMDKIVLMEMRRFLHPLEDEDIELHQDGEDQEETLGQPRAGPGRNDLSSDDDANDADYEVEDDDDYPSNRRKKLLKRGGVAGRGGSSRGRGSGRGRGGRTSKRQRPADPFNTSDYKSKDPTEVEVCPHPPPKKLRGGRRTMMKEALATEVPEGDVQLACLGLKGNEISKKLDIRCPVRPFTGTIFTPIMRTMYLYDRNSSHRAGLMRSAGDMAVAMDNSGTLMQLIRSTEKNKPFQLNAILKSAMMNYATQCAIAGRQLDCTKWLMDLGYEFFTNPRFSRLKFREVVAEADGQNREWEDGAIYHDTFATRLTRTKLDLMTTMNKLITGACRVCDSLKEGRARVEEIRKKKFFVQEKYQQLFQELSNRDSKFDEMSITGVRCIKLMMDGPYLKTEDALLAFQLPHDNLALSIRTDLPFHSEKQKWTSKDLQALKQIIKECILAKRIDDLNSRYLELLNESDMRRFEELCQEGKSVDKLYQAPQKRRRGRPTKEETSQRDKYGVVYPSILRSPSTIIAYTIQPKQLSEWRTWREKRLRNMSFDTLLKEKDTETLIDWDDVSLKLMIRTKKLRLEADCQLTYKHEADPAVNSKRLTVEETKKIKLLYEDQTKNWDEIAVEMNMPALVIAAFRDPGSGEQQGPPLHTPYQFFSRYISRVAPPAKPEWDEMMDEKVKMGLAEYPAHWRKVAAIVDNEAVTKKVVVERYKKAITPLLKVGPFSRVEDCLLLLTIQRLQAFMGEEGHFGSLLAYLPWRYETTWRDRAHNLFNDWIVPWTIEEDRLLLDLEKTMSRNWQKISEQFTSFKNRKGCLTRYKILKRNLEKKKNSSLEEYHEAYAMTRYNVFQYRHLKEILTMLKKMQDVKLPNGARFLLNPNRDKPPTETELQCMLVTYDRTVLKDTIATMEKYITGRDEYWQTWLAENGDRKRTFDRRTFHPENPKSVASAIHIRRLKLKPKSQFNNLNDFEKDIYLHYGRFSRTKELNLKTKRPYLPPASFFIEWNSVQRIIDDPDGVAEDETDQPCSKKWIRLMNKRTIMGNAKQGTTKKTKKRKKKDMDEDSDTLSETEVEDDDVTESESDE